MEIYEEPNELTPNNVVYYSSTYQKLLALEKSGKWKTYAICIKARRFLREGCIEYSKEKKCYVCLPIKGYNKTTYEMRPFEHKTYENEEVKEVIKSFNCTCQFHQRVVSKQNMPHLCCSHVLGLKLMLKMWNYNKRKDKEMYPENYE